MRYTFKKVSRAQLINIVLNAVRSLESNSDSYELSIDVDDFLSSVSYKQKALSKLNEIVLLFNVEHKFNLDSLFDLKDLISAIKESV